MKKIIILLFVLLNHFVEAQNIKIENDIAYVDGIEYVNIKKSKKNKYKISSIQSQEKLFVIKIITPYNVFTKRKHFLPQLRWIEKKKTIGFEVDDIKNSIDAVKFLYQFKFITKEGKVNEIELQKYIYS
ncbi:hypothetical protein CLV86_0512 [Lacinutrix venerupis]|uniref:hypothetical protein n=1 Tax=Lacinutrix venerupis TaxID=1486034 RepID=UPI000F0E0043|nr:hypothetical protein [Lacinutrix venerupis]RLJ69118.1 hypothetical protein CLV86_0512 [Lacinutrix venerupis]